MFLSLGLQKERPSYRRSLQLSKRTSSNSASVADPDPGSGIGCFLSPGSGIRNRFIPDPGSRIPNLYFWEPSDNFLGKKFHNSLKFGPNFFLEQFKNLIILHFVKFVATKKCLTKNFHPSLFYLFLDPGSVIRDPGSGMGKNQDPGFGINIPDPQHWIQHMKFLHFFLFLLVIFALLDSDPHMECGSGSSNSNYCGSTRIRIRNPNFLKCWMFSLKRWRLLLWLCVVYGGLGIEKLFDNKKISPLFSDCG